jgi:hypothetical protein
MEIEVHEIRERFGRAATRDLARTYEASEALRHLDVNEMRCMELVLRSEQTGLHSRAERRLQEKLQEGRGVDDNHAESRSSRMIVAAAVFNVTRFRP